MLSVGLGVPLRFARKEQNKKNGPDQREVQKEIRQVQGGLSLDLLNAEWREKNVASGNPLVGHCYVAAEALFHRLGGKKNGWQSYMLNHKLWPEGCDPGETHWFLKHKSGVIADPTAGQYGEQAVDYNRGKPCGFLTVKPSQRARTLLSRIRQALAKLG